MRKYAGLFGALALVEGLARPLPVQHLAVNILKKSSFPIYTCFYLFAESLFVVFAQLWSPMGVCRGMAVCALLCVPAKALPEEFADQPRACPRSLEWNESALILVKSATTTIGPWTAALVQRIRPLK